MQFVTGMDQLVADWVARHIPGVENGHSFSPCVAVGLMEGGELVAGCVYNNYRKGSQDIEMTFASVHPSWASRRTLKNFFWYPFIQLGCVRVTAIVAKKNKKVRKFVERVGFKQEGVMRKAMNGVEDAVIYGMLSRECKWIKEMNHGKEIGTIGT